MPDPQTPSTIFGDVPTYGSSGTNEAMPRFGGQANPGESIHIEIDGEEHIIQPDDNGMWDYSTPELSNGEHEFEMWSENQEGDRSDSAEWETDVSSTENDREWQRQRNEDWSESGRDAWRDENSDLTSTPVSAGGGGGQTTGGGSGSGRSGGGGTGTPEAGVEKGNRPGARVMG